MRVRHFAAHCRYFAMGVLVLFTLGPPPVRAQGGGADVTTQHQLPAPNNALVRLVRESTERFRDVAVAEAEGYHLLFGCVSDDDEGAMGLHYVNLPLVADGELDPTRPEIVIYEPTPGGACGSSARTFWCSRRPGTRRASGRRNSWDSSFTCS